MRKINISKSLLYKEYIIDNNSCKEIAKRIGCSWSTIRRNLIKDEIKIKTISEARKGKFKGKNASNYRDGRKKAKHCCINCEKRISYNAWKYGKSRCLSCASKLKWGDEEYREKTLKAIFKTNNLQSNNLEKLLIKLFNKILPNQYTFVGNGKLIVGGFVPDFVNKDNNKIIEMFGCYWHKCLKCGFGDGRAVDVGRLKEYKKANYQTLIIWEHELKDLDKVENKIQKFNKIGEKTND